MGVMEQYSPRHDARLNMLVPWKSHFFPLIFTPLTHAAFHFHPCMWFIRQKLKNFSADIALASLILAVYF